MNHLRIIPIIALLAASAPTAAAQLTDSSRETSQVRLMRPSVLTRSVIGDSARFYALEYEHYERRRVEFALTGAAIMALGLVTAIPHPCQKPWCTVRPPASVNRPLVMAGGTLALASLVYRVRAAQASVRASWWHDASLAR
jgi:hypothetical protein